jgi:hypothetical protein
MLITCADIVRAGQLFPLKSSRAKGADKMGDFADMALSDTMDMEDLRMEYRLGLGQFAGRMGDLHET